MHVFISCVVAIKRTKPKRFTLFSFSTRFPYFNFERKTRKSKPIILCHWQKYYLWRKIVTSFFGGNQWDRWKKDSDIARYWTPKPNYFISYLWGYLVKIRSMKNVLCTALVNLRLKSKNFLFQFPISEKDFPHIHSGLLPHGIWNKI